jgi:hypothetical protein
MAALVPAGLPAGSKASFDVMRVSTFPAGSPAARPHPLNGLEKNPAISTCSLVYCQKSPRRPAFAQQSFMVPSSKIEK